MGDKKHKKTTGDNGNQIENSFHWLHKNNPEYMSIIN